MKNKSPISLRNILKGFNKKKRRTNNAQEQTNPAPHERHGTTSDKISVIVNAILAALTLVAIYLTYQANKTSQAALEYAKNKDSSDNIEQRKKDIIAENERVFNRKYVDSTLYISQQGVDAANRSSKIAENALDETKKSYEFSRESAVKEIRAYMVVDDISVTKLAPDSVIIEFRFTNVGKTPAYNVTIESGEVAGFSQTSENVILFIKKMPFFNGNESRATVGSNQKIPSILYVNKLKKNDINLIKLGKYKMFATASIVYYDIFKIRRFTHVFAEYDYSTKSFYNCNTFNDSN